MSPVNTAYNAVGNAYDARLAELSQAFWAGMGGSSGKILGSKIIYEEEVDITKKPASSDSSSGDYSDTSDYTNPREGRRFAAQPIIVNGVVLSQVAADQLRRLGLPLEWYTAGELEDAEQACAADATLIDDDEGHNFSDRLHLDYNEHPDRGLHGFSKDDFEENGLYKRPQKRLRKTDENKHMGLIPCDIKDDIFAGMRMLSNPMHVKANCDHLKNGLDNSPRLQLDTEKTLVA